MNNYNNPLLQVAFNLPLLTEEQLNTLLKNRDTDPEAVYTIAIHNMRLAYPMATRTINGLYYLKSNTYDPDDVWQEMYLALVRAATDYRPGEASYSTLAYKYVNTECMRILKYVKCQSAHHEEQDFSMKHQEPATEISDQEMFDIMTDMDQLYKELHKVLTMALDEQEYMVMTFAYGINCEIMSREEISKFTGLSINRIEKIIPKCIRTMKNFIISRNRFGDPEFPLLLKYWTDTNKETLIAYITPLLLDDDYDDDDMDLLDEALVYDPAEHTNTVFDLPDDEYDEMDELYGYSGGEDE